MDYNKIYINSSNIIDNLESMYYKTNNIKLKNKILYEINKYKKLNEICLIKNPNIKENIIHKLSNDFLFIIKLNKSSILEFILLSCTFLYIGYVLLNI